MSDRLAMVFCVHHKPWLIMATLISALLQDDQDADLHVVYNVGDGECLTKASYQDYHRGIRDAEASSAAMTDGHSAIETQLDRRARQCGRNPKLSPFDARLREVCRLARPSVSEVEFENDHALDSGAWYKFIRSGQWRAYDYVGFIQEGTLFTRSTVLSAVRHMASVRPLHFLASGHYKSRLPKALFLSYNTREPAPLPVDHLHDQMIRATFEVFCRDEAFRRLFEDWSDGFAATQQNHVPDLWANPLERRLRTAANRRGPLTRHPLKRPLSALLRRSQGWFPRADAWLASLKLSLAGLAPRIGQLPSRGLDDNIYVDMVRRRIGEVVRDVTQINGVKFHRESGPEWHGCSCNHLFSRTVLERLAERLERFNLYEALELPFAGTALEVIWGFLPAWLGTEKWFFDGWHRVMKDFATYRREDDPEGMASYLNRYYAGQLCVGWDGDYLKIRRARGPAAARLREILPVCYF